jgi:hypothetical protein
MGGWDYLILDTKESDEKAKLARLAKLGEESWELVAVDEGVLYFKRYANYAAQLRPNVAAESHDQPLIQTMVPDTAAGQKRFDSVTSMDAGPDMADHFHKLIVVVDRDMQVVRGETDEVLDHVHPITVVGAVDEASGHTHKFNVFAGGDRSHQY